MELFRNTEPTFEKLAKRITLSDNESTWPNEMMAALYKQHDFLGSYSVNLKIEGQDDNLGYLYGSFIVGNPSDMAVSQGMPGSQGPQEVKQQAPGAVELRVPVIVEDGKLYSFDVFITPDSRFQPLTKRRVEQALQQVAPYSPVSSRDAMPLAPMTTSGMQPEVPNAGLGHSRGLGGSNAPYSVKTASASILDTALALTPPVKKNEFLKQAASDPWVISQLGSRPAFSDAMNRIAASADTSPEEELMAADDFDVAVLTKVAGGFEITLGTNDGRVAPPIRMTNAQASGIPAQARNDAMRYGAALLSGNETSITKEATDSLGFDYVDSPGVYDLVAPGAKGVTGFVFNVKNVDGSDTRTKLAMSTEGNSFQNDIAGIKRGQLEMMKFAEDKTSGEGVFYTGGDSVVGPLSLRTRVDRHGGTTTYFCSDAYGVNYELTKLAGATRPIKISEGNYYIPEEYTWVSMSTNAIRYEDDPFVVEKTASFVSDRRMIHLLSSGDEFTFKGIPVEKVASDNLKYPQATMLLGVLGASPNDARDLLKEASEWGEVRFEPGRTIDFQEEKTVLASVDTSFMPSLDFVKIAASIRDHSDTVDAVLSLGFVTPENIQAYVDNLPMFEEAVFSLSEMLIGARLGVPDIKENAVLSAVKGLDRIVDSLRELSLRKSPGVENA